MTYGTLHLATFNQAQVRHGRIPTTAPSEARRQTPRRREFNEFRVIILLNEFIQLIF